MSAAGLRDATRLLEGHLRAHDFRGLLRPPRARPRLGAELEFIPVDARTRRVAPIETPDGRGVAPALAALAEREGWCREASPKGAPVFRTRHGGRLTFEPGGQLEYATPPMPGATALLRDLRRTAGLLRETLAERGIGLVSLGIDPHNALADVPLQVDADRYRRMDRYFARLGPAGARMMRQTASLQVALDGDDVARRWPLLNALAPYLVARFANGRCYADLDSGCASFRAETWRAVDPARTGIFAADDPVPEYLDFALRAPAVLEGDADEAPLPFARWAARGTSLDRWTRHLSTLFPEVRPRGYLEVRSLDALPEAMLPAAVVFLAGLLYHEPTAHDAAEVVGAPDATLLERAGRAGLADPRLAHGAYELGALALRGAAALGPAFVSEEDLAEAAAVLRVAAPASRGPDGP